MTAKDLATCARDAILRSGLELQRFQLQCQPPDRQMLGLLWERCETLAKQYPPCLQAQLSCNLCHMSYNQDTAFAVLHQQLRLVRYNCHSCPTICCL